MPVHIPKDGGSITVRQLGENVLLLDEHGRQLCPPMPWPKAEELSKAILAKSLDAERYTWSLIEGKHVDPSFCRVKRIFHVPVITSRAELERLD